MTLEQLAAVARAVFGVRGLGQKKETGRVKQAPTVALGWREGWNVLFVAIQGKTVTSDHRRALALACNAVGQTPEIIDARALAAGYRRWMKCGRQTACAHAEMVVLAAMLSFRADTVVDGLRAALAVPSKTAPGRKVHPADHERNRIDLTTLKNMFRTGGRQARIVANALNCHFCWHMLNDLAIERGGLDKTGELTIVPDKRPLTGWWNPLQDKSYGHATPS